MDSKVALNVEGLKKNQGENIDLMEYLGYLFQKRKMIATAAFVGMLFMFIHSLLAAPVYVATSQLYVVTSRDSVLNLADLQIGTYLTNDYQLVFETWEVNQMVIENLDLPYTVKELREMVYVTNPSDTRALYIHAESKNAKEAADIANEFASVARRYISEVMCSEEPTLFSMALEPLEPEGPKVLQNTALGFAAGLLIAIVAASLIFVLDDKVRTPEDLKKITGLSPLAVIPSKKHVGAAQEGTD